MMSKKTHNLRLSERLERMRTPAGEIIIDSGAGSLLPYKEDRDVEATRRGLASIRKTAAEHRTEKSKENND